MCTLSWRFHPLGYQLAFNRDESKLRAVASPPRVMGQAIMPIDPDGGGTWLAVNRWGTSYALLNAYEYEEQALTSKGAGRVSRGTLIPQLIGYTDAAAIEGRLAQLVGSHYAAFRLCMIGRNGQAALWCWNGSRLLREAAVAPVVSAGENLAQIKQIRSALFNDFVGDLGDLHATHWPQKGRQSICMHRTFASTVSLSVINVTDRQIEFKYHSSSPCLHRAWELVTMPLALHQDGQERVVDE